MWAFLFLSACPEADAPPSGGPGLAPSGRPDVLLVVMDTVRADALGAYGNSRRTSPQFDAVAAAGALFLDATSPASWTWPSHASLFTGLYPWEHGAHFASGGDEDAMHPAGEPFSASPMRTDVPTLAEAFSSAGYRTVSVSSNALLDPALGLVRGFSSARVYVEDRDTLRAAVGAIAEPDPRPLLLFVNLMGAHSPWNIVEQPWVSPHLPLLRSDAPPAWLAAFVEPGFPFVHPYLVRGGGRSGGVQYMRGELPLPPEALRLFRDLYEGEVSVVDAALTTLVRKWNASGRDDGIVAVTSDHGELLGERQIIGHGRVLWPELLHVPLAIAWPGHIAPNTRIAAPVQSHWLYGTLLGAAGIPAIAAKSSPITSPEAGRLQPVDLLAVRPDQAWVGDIAAAEWRDDYWAREIGAAFQSSWRYLRQVEGAVLVEVDAEGKEHPAMFDPAADPAFANDLATARPERVSTLASLARERIPLTATVAMTDLDPATAAMLHALGYADAPKPTPRPTPEAAP